MNIIYAAEKPSIAGILSDYLSYRVEPADIEVADNPDETGSFYVRWNLRRFILLPDGNLFTELLSD